MRHRHLVAALSCIAFFPTAAGCDSLVQDDGAAQIAPKTDIKRQAMARVVENVDYLLPVRDAQVIIEGISANGTILDAEPVTVQTDAEGYFTVPPMPDDVAKVTANVFVAGELVGIQELELERGEPIAKAIIIVALTTWVICVATMWASAKKAAGSNDKLGHCIATCRTARWCGGAIVAGVMKEVFDELCSKFPADHWIRKLVAGASGCSGWDNADLIADARGVQCSPKLWKSCEKCCSAYY